MPKNISGNRAAVISSESLSLDLYRKLYMARRAEEFIIEYYHEDDMKTPMHMSMGQEAIAVGVCHALGLDNQIWTSYRTHAAFLAKTEDTEQFFGELYGKVTGISAGKAGSMHLADPSKGHMAASAVVASILPSAVGMAFANKRNATGHISCVFFGDGALDEGVFWESLNLACVMDLPVLFVCEDNKLAVHTSTHIRQGYNSITDVISRFSCTVIQENTTDVERIYTITKEAMNTIHTTQKPVFLHLECYRYLEHVGINEDFDAGYRSKEEYERWYEQDCVKLQRERLINQGFSSADLRKAESVIDNQLLTSIRKAQAAPFPQPEELYRGVFYEAD